MIADRRTSLLERFHAATHRLDALIDGTPTPGDTSRQAIQARATHRMDRLRRFLAILGNPHQGYPIIHIGGTSGKGSTSTMIASILASAGYETGLHTSPYLQTPAEKLQLNGELIAPETYVALCHTIFHAHDQWLESGEEPLTYGEAWFALTALFFRESRVELAVLEVGAGGRFDLTNIVDPVLSVITSVGIDHTQTLGETIPEIAWHKAGIIKPGVPAVSAVAHPEASAIIAGEASAVGADLVELDLGTTVTKVATGIDGTDWTDGRSGKRHRTALRGAFQARNGATATAAIDALRRRRFAIPDAAVDQGLETARIPGRVEIIDDGSHVLLDGAHNMDKVSALAADLPLLLPVPPGRSRIGVLGVLEAKQAAAMIAALVPVMDMLVATSPRITAKDARAAGEIAGIAAVHGFHGPVWIEPEPRAAIDRAVALANREPGDAVFVTGSLYLVGNVRERWYAADDIVIARSPWPAMRNPD